MSRVDEKLKHKRYERQENTKVSRFRRDRRNDKRKAYEILIDPRK